MLADGHVGRDQRTSIRRYNFIASRMPGAGERCVDQGIRPVKWAKGLTLGLSLSVINLAGLFLTILILGGLGAWSPAQFIGVFGIFEIATGIAFVVCPNAWRLPVVSVDSGRGHRTALAASTIFIPHWAGGAKSLAGLAMVAGVAASEGAGWATLGIIPLSLATAVFVTATSIAASRFGVLRPDLDVVRFTIHRPRREDRRLPGMSLTASFLQIVLGAFTLPAIKVLPPSAFYQPEIGPSAAVVGWMSLAALLAVVGVFAVWRGALTVQAHPAQQLEAEKPA